MMKLDKIKEKCKEIGKNPIMRMRFLLLAAFIFIITLMAWQSDDAYHGYVMAKHLVEGNGFVYNIGQRASASTGPLYTLIIALFYFLTGEMYFTSLAVNIIFSAIAYGIVSFCFCKTREQVVYAFLALVASPSFISYTTSGLENCLLFLLVAWFLKCYYEKESFNSLELLRLALILSALAMARMDAALMLVPMIVYVYLMKRDRVSFPKAVGLTFLGLAPFILWVLFSTFYFGFPVPNTAYVKLGTDIALAEYIKKGIWYIYYTFLNDMVVLLLPAIYIMTTIFTRSMKHICQALGILLYGAYVVYIGGDFMMGRHFTVLLLMSVIGIVRVSNFLAGIDIRLAGKSARVFRACALISVVYLMTFVPLIGSQYLVNGCFEPGGAISDERAYYWPTTGLFPNVRSLIRTGRLCIEDTWNYDSVEEIRENGWRGNITSNSAGILVYYNSDLYLNDTYCLGDPFLSKLPAIKQDTWRVGHLRRAVPDGYYETVMYGKNVIADDDLAKYYDIICEMTQGELFSADRLKTVIEWNMGKYDYLLEHYTAGLKEDEK